jgi:hypothetical protein
MGNTCVLLFTYNKNTVFYSLVLIEVSKIQALTDILRDIFWKSDHFWPCNEFFKTLCIFLKYLTSIVFVVVVVSRSHFFHKTSSFNSLHGQISIDFDVISLKILVKLRKTDDKKIILDKYPSYSGKTKFIKFKVPMKFCSVARTKNASFRIVF